MSQRLGALPGRGSPARLRGMSKAQDQTLIALPWRALHQWHAGLQQAFAHIEQDDALRYLAQAIGHLVSIESVMVVTAGVGFGTRFSKLPPLAPVIVVVTVLPLL